MKRTFLIVFAAIAAACLLLGGCSAKNSGASNYMPNYDYALEGDLAPADRDNVLPDPSGTKPTDVLVNRKIVRNASLRVETLEFDKLLETLTGRTAELGGYIESNSVSGRGYYQSKALRTAELVLRIPADKLDTFLNDVDGACNVLSRNENVSDITDTYVDTEARLSSLRTEYDTLLDLLARAETLDEIIMLQDRLSQVRYEIESYEARIRSYDSLVSFSTVRIDVSEVERETVVEPETFGQEISRRFSESLESVGNGFRDFAVWFIGNLPELLVLLFFLVALPLIIVLICVKSAKKRAAKRRQAAEAKKAQESAAAEAPAKLE